jgi:proline iminopeptidase
VKNIYLAVALLIALAWYGAAHAGEADISLRHFTTSDGAELTYLVAGKGTPCIFIHGGPGQGWESFRRMGGGRLEEVAKILYLDQRGSGHSPDAKDYSLQRVVEDIEEARKHAGLPKICVIAHSFGGIIAVNYAKRYPARVTRLVLANATLHFLSQETLWMQIEALSGLLAHPSTLPEKDAPLEALEFARRDIRSRLNAEGRGYLQFTNQRSTLDQMMEIDAGYARSRGFGNAVMANRTDYPEYYASHVAITKEIEIPTLIIAGSRDYVVGAEHHRGFRFPCFSTTVLDTGHMPYADAPDSFATAIKEFLDHGKAVGCSISRRSAARTRSASSRETAP